MFASRTNWRLETNRLTRALEEHRRSGKELFDLTASNPTTCGFAYPEREILAALTDPRGLVYRPESKGLREAREAVAEYYAGRAGFSGSVARVDPERILLSSGTSEAYSHIFRLLCEAGDEILVPAPSYPLFEFLADLADIHLVPYPLLYDHGWQIDFASLRAALTPRSRAVLVVHPNNPTGSFVKPREAAELAEICAAREMAIVADEVFLDYASSATTAHTFALSDAALTFTLSGLSKISLLPADEIGLDGRERTGCRGSNRHRPPRNHRGYVSFTQHAGATRPAEISLAPTFAAGAIAAENFRESFRPGQSVARIEIPRASRSRRRLVRHPARPGHGNG